MPYQSPSVRPFTAMMKPQVTRCIVTQTVRMAAVKSAWRSDSLVGLAPSELAQIYQNFIDPPNR